MESIKNVSDINRHYYSKEEIKKSFEDRKIVNDIRDLMKLHNSNAAIGLDGGMHYWSYGNAFIIIRKYGEYKAILKANLKTHDFTIEV